MKLKNCVCKRKVEVYEEEEGFTVSCPRCGKSIEPQSSIDKAIECWNREKTVEDMIKGVNLDAVIVG